MLGRDRQPAGCRGRDRRDRARLARRQSSAAQISTRFETGSKLAQISYQTRLLLASEHEPQRSGLRCWHERPARNQTPGLLARIVPDADDVGSSSPALDLDAPAAIGEPGTPIPQGFRSRRLSDVFQLDAAVRDWGPVLTHKDKIEPESI